MQVSDGQNIFIRKTTAVWLLQEGERVSTDRLFRVRQKQPYSTNVYCCTNTSTNSTNNIGTTIPDLKITATILDAVIPSSVPSRSRSCVEQPI